MNRSCPDCTEKGHPGFRDPRHSDAFCRTCDGEGELTVDDLVQSSRDQGIRDACANAPAAYRFWHDGALCVRTTGGGYLVIEAAESSVEYRAAFAYARAYEANR